MTEPTLAEKLRAYMDADQALASALESLDRTEAAMWSDDDRSCYLRGHDDAKAESAGAIAVLREEGKRLTARVRELEAQMNGYRDELEKTANALQWDFQDEDPLPLHARATMRMNELRRYDDENESLHTRVKELEATLLDEHSRLAQAEAQPAAVGVVGGVRWGVLSDEDAFEVNVAWRERRGADAMSKVTGHRVVAIVDPAQIVPLASAEVVGVISQTGSLFGPGFLGKAGWSDCAPVYPGIAQPAQEREG
jgi:chaperonin cofactor prefoldin